MTTPSLNHSSSILIVGAGTWGCSTALHLVRRGYTDVTILDPYPVPSPIAAGNDVNKIMEHKELKGTRHQKKARLGYCKTHTNNTQGPIRTPEALHLLLAREPLWMVGKMTLSLNHTSTRPGS